MRRFLRFGVAISVFSIVYPALPASVSRPGSPPSIARAPSPPPPRIATPAPKIETPRVEAPKPPAGGVTRQPEAGLPAGGVSRPQLQSPSVTDNKSVGSQTPVQSGMPAGGVPRQAVGTPNGTPAGGVSRPAAVPGVAPPRPPSAPPSAIDNRMTQGHSQDALNKLRADQNAFKKPPVNVPETRQAALQTPIMRQYGSRWGSADQYYQNRDAALGRLPPAYNNYWNHPPQYVLNSPSAYGGYNTRFLYGLLGVAAGVGVAVVAIDASNAMWAYSHRTDPSYMAWHRDMMAQAANDAELNARMVAFNARISQMEAQNVVANPDALPEGIDPSLVVAPETVLMATASSEDVDTPQQPVSPPPVKPGWDNQDRP